MKITADQINKNRPALFDWIVVTTSFSLGFIFPVLGEFVFSSRFSWWMLTALVLYVAGVVLKHQPLSNRVYFSKRKRAIPYVLFLIVGHWCIFMAVIFFCGTAVFSVIGGPGSEKNIYNSGPFIFTAMFLPGIITWLVFRNKVPSDRIIRASDEYLFRRELIGDILLATSVSFISFVFWEKGVIALLSNRPASSFDEVWFIFVFLSIAYILFYLPIRYLYLLEDHSSRQTWKRMLLIFALLLIRSLLEMLII